MSLEGSDYTSVDTENANEVPDTKESIIDSSIKGLDDLKQMYAEANENETSSTEEHEWSETEEEEMLTRELSDEVNSWEILIREPFDEASTIEVYPEDTPEKTEALWQMDE